MALFSRKTPRAWPQRLRNGVWPDLGWRRWLRYVSQRLLRIPGSPHNIAAGFAFGVVVSFTPFIGLHILLGASLAYLFRGNMVAAAVGTLAGNPWSFPLIWLWIFSFGNWLLALIAEMPVLEGQAAPIASLSIDYLLAHPFDIFWPMALGGVVTAVILWPLLYWPLKKLVAGYQQAKRHRRTARRSQTTQSCPQPYQKIKSEAVS